jgi:hypothetical protein
MMPKKSKAYQGKNPRPPVSIATQLATIAESPRAEIDTEGLGTDQKKQLETGRDIARRRQYLPSKPSQGRESEVLSDDQLIAAIGSHEPNELDDLKALYDWIPSFYRCYKKAFGVSVDEVRASIVRFNDVDL